MLRRCLDEAVKDKYINENPMDRISRLKEDDVETIALTETEAKKLLDTAANGNYIYNNVENRNYIKRDLGTEYYIKQFYVLILILLAAGLRIGEAAGLNWNAIDFDTGTIYIRQQLVHVGNKNYLTKSLKTDSSYRDIVLNADIIDELRKFKNFQSQYAEILGDKFTNCHNLVFTNTFGGLMSVNNFRRRYFSKMIREAGISEKFGIHGCRRTTATLLVDSGANIRAVADTLGHKSVRTLLDIYTKTTKRAKQEIAEVMSKNLKHD